MGDKGPMDRQEEAATGGVVVFVDFQRKVASYEPLPAPAIDWMAMARDAEEDALTAPTERQRRALIRCALQFRAKARSV